MWDHKFGLHVQVSYKSKDNCPKTDKGRGDYLAVVQLRDTEWV